MTDGLVSFYSGTHNTRDGHDESSKVWEDLVGTNDMTLTGGYFTSEGYYSNASYSMLPSDATSVLKGNVFTMEMYVSDFEPLGTVNDETGRLLYNTAQNFRVSYMSSADQIRFTLCKRAMKLWTGIYAGYSITLQTITLPFFSFQIMAR